MQQFTTDSVSLTEDIARRLAKTMKGNEVIALFGDLGAGKTAFTRGFADELDAGDEVSSPTFALVNEYNGRYDIYHFDMYRIGSYDDLYSTGFFDYLGNGILIIEWSENIVEYLPEDRIEVHIDRLSDNERRITIEGADIL